MNQDYELPKGFSVIRAHESQKRLSRHLITEDKLPKKIKYIAGVDVAYSGNKAVGAVAVLDYNTLGLLEYRTAIQDILFPYIPTLLSYREIPPSMACIKKLTLEPDVFLVNGHGLAHPFRCGFASHLGLAIRKPTIGVAKSNLTGEILKVGNDILIVDNGDVVGSLVIMRNCSKPIFVSIGHMVSLERATTIVRQCTRNGCIPEPIRIAHCIATEERKNVSIESVIRKLANG
jgi:deoxyribonuclease V